MSKTVLITGIQGNLGTAVANVFHAAGFKVAGTVIPDEPIRAATLKSDFAVFPVDLRSDAAAIDMLA